MADKAGSDAAVVETATLRWRFARVDFDTRSGDIRVDGKLVTLERKPREMLRVFLKRPGELLTKSELLEAVWPGRIVSDASLTNCVAKLRNAIGDPDGDLLRTVHGYGYRLACAVQIAPHESEPASSLSKSEPGNEMPVLEGWRLQERLIQGPHLEVWRAQAIDSGVDRILKLARSGLGVDQLRREVALNRYLEDRLGAGMPACAVLGLRLDEAPFFIELESHGGSALPDYLAQQGPHLDDSVRILLMLRLADVVATLHSYGVLHGSLNPASFLLEAREGKPPRLFFGELGSGQARALGLTDSPPVSSEDRSTTETNPYAAPELRSGSPLSLQSDVYALGVILYQVWTGDFTRPLAPGWEQQVGDPLLCQDIASACHIDPAQRLSDAGELLRRLRNLESRRATLDEAERGRVRLELAEKAVQRAKARRGPLMALAAALVAGLCVTTWLALNLRQAVIEEQRSAAVASAVTEFLTKDLLAPANSVSGHGADVTIGTLLDRAAASLDTRFADQPLMHASLQRVLGTAYAALNEPDRAIPLLLAAETSLAQLIGPAAPETETVRLTLQELLVNLPLTPTRLDGMEAVARRQLDAENAAGNPHPVAGYIARVVLNSVACWRESGIIRGANCAKVLDGLIAEASRTLGVGHPVMLRLNHSRASLMGVAGLADEAVPEFRKSLAGLEKIHGPDSPKLTLLFLQMSKALEYGGDPAQVIPLLERAIRSFSVNLGGEHPYLWNARRALGMAYTRAGRHYEAIELQRSQLEKVTARYGSGGRERLTALRFLVAAEVAGDQLSLAMAHAQEALELDARIEADRYDRFELMDLMASVHERQGNPALATAKLRELLLEVRTKAPGADVPIGRYELHKARLLLALGRPAEALAAADRAMESLARALDPTSALVRDAVALRASARDKLPPGQP